MLNLLIIGNLVMIVVFLLKLNFLPPQIPLFYNLTGEKQIADTWMIFILPFLLNIFFILNNYLLKKYFLNHQLVKSIFDYLFLFFLIGFTLIFLKIIFLVS